MKKKILTAVIGLATLMLFSAASFAIDTVPLPEYPSSIYWSTKMIGTWPTPERPYSPYRR